MIENTIENKRIFSSLYYGQRIMRFTTWNDFFNVLNNDGSFSRGYEVYPKTVSICSFLELTPLNLITDEDAEFCIGKRECELRRNNPESFDFGMSPSGIFVNSLNVEGSTHHIGRIEADYLRLKGYAVKWINLSVTEQIKYGWITLKND